MSVNRSRHFANPYVFPNDQDHISKRDASIASDLRFAMLFQNYKHLATNGAKTSSICHLRAVRRGLPYLGHVRVVGLLFD